MNLLAYIIYAIALLFVTAYVAINIFHILKFRFDPSSGDWSTVALFTYIVVAVSVIGISIIGAIISYNL